jgi:hypothetical protein
MDLPELVAALNKLERSPKSQSGLVDNHWQFAVQHVHIEPAGDLLHLVNPGSRFCHTEGPAAILSATSAAARADIVIPLLLKAFVNATGNQHDPRVSPCAPWSWGTDDTELAKALQKTLKTVGVRKELCVVQVGDEENIKIQREEWTKILRSVKALVEPRCNKCKGGPPGEKWKLQLCGGCKTAHYCSRDCQKADWKEHKTICKDLANDTNPGSSSSPSSTSATEYYENIAPSMPEAQRLAREVGLTLPGRRGIA